MLLPMLVLVPIALGMILYLTQFKAYRPVGLMIQSFLLGAAVYLFVQIDVVHKRPIIHSLGHLPQNIAINLYADNISAILVVLTATLYVFMLIYAYKKPYMNQQFMFLFLVLEGLIIGTFLAQDLFTLYALIEVSTIVVSILIMYKKGATGIYDGIVYLFTNMVAMTFYLIGVGYVYKIFGTLDMLQLRILVPLIENPRTLILPYAFMMTAVGLKSAVMPLFSWLPHAHGSHSAPYIVSAILSGLYVKGSLYIFIRLQAIFGQTLGTHSLFIVLGVITAFVAMFLALSQKDIKLILAYSTVSQIGLIILGLSLSSTYSYYGAIYHIVNHALFKSALFLIAGILIDAYGTRDMSKIKGVFRQMPLTAIAMIIAILGITGAPLFNGSISKYLIQEGLASHRLLEYAMLLINVGTITYFIKFVPLLFGHPGDLEPIDHNRKAVVFILSALCFVGGVFGHTFANIFFDLHITWSLADYLEKLVIYGISIASAYAFYKYVYLRHHIFTTIQEVELTFNELIMSIFLFFAGLLGYLMIVV